MGGLKVEPYQEITRNFAFHLLLALWKSFLWLPRDSWELVDGFSHLTLEDKFADTFGCPVLQYLSLVMWPEKGQLG